ncbi:MAG TPA: hypothetical protein VE445_07975 [Nitrososphaeraceae archaeon]|nr:hypothetical protein [Nitrososphaeraceae archaeon]
MIIVPMNMDYLWEVLGLMIGIGCKDTIFENGRLSPSIVISQLCKQTAITFLLNEDR